jgi:DNA-binding NarL/FixJ family response regulator
MTDPSSAEPAATSATPASFRSRERLRVVVVDADHRVRQSVAGLIELAEGTEVVGSAAHPGEAVALVVRVDPDVVLIDPRLPEPADGVALIDVLRVAAPHARVLVMSWSAGLEHAALARIADGFIDKNADPVAFVDAILAAGGRSRRPNPPRPPRQGES